MPKAVKKVIKISLIVLIVLFPVYIIMWAITPFFMPKLTTKTDNDAYLTGKYKQYSGGGRAGEYFPDPEELGDYENLEFTFVDNFWRRVYFRRIGNRFTLEVKYDNENYEAATSAMTEKYQDDDVFLLYDGCCSRDDVELAFRKTLPSSNRRCGTDDFYVIFCDGSKKISFIYYVDDTVVSDQGVYPDKDPLGTRLKEKYYFKTSFGG